MCTEDEIPHHTHTHTDVWIEMQGKKGWIRQISGSQCDITVMKMTVDYEGLHVAGKKITV